MYGLAFAPGAALAGRAAWSSPAATPLLARPTAAATRMRSSTTGGGAVFREYDEDEPRKFNMNGLGRSMPKPRYDSLDWWSNVLSTFKAPTWRRIRLRVLFHMLSTLLVLAFFHAYPAQMAFFSQGINPTPHSLLGFALGLLLVFRTNSAYDRYWEGRKTWGMMVTSVRALAHLAHRALDPLARDHMLLLLSVFPRCWLHHTLTRVTEEEERQHQAYVRTIMDDDAELVLSSKNGPLVLCKMMSVVFQHSLNDPYRLGFVMASENTPERAQWRNSLYLQEVKQSWADWAYNERALIASVGAAERLVRSTVPLSYSRHTSRFMTMWCFTLPFALIPTMMWRAVPIILGMCWALFTIEEVGHIIEDPFNISPDDYNTLGLHKSTSDVVDDVVDKVPFDAFALQGLDELEQTATGIPWMHKNHWFHSRYRLKVVD